MPQERDQLNYASPPPLKRPPVYSLVLGVLAAVFLMAFGGAIGFALLASAYARFWRGDQRVELWFFLVFMPVAAIFIGAGLITMLSTVAALRGKSIVGMPWARWATVLNRAYFVDEKYREK
jgi:hypothetical protein